MLEVASLTKTYAPPGRVLRHFVRSAITAPVHALSDVSFAIEPGEILGLVGPNGAGKTTLIKILGGLLEPTSGRAVVDGCDVGRDPMAARRRLGLVLAEDRGLYWRLTGRQNLELFGALHGLSRRDAQARAEELLDLSDLIDADKLVFGYSAGQRARLNLARSLVGRPRVLVLDEPTRSLDPLATAKVGQLLKELAADGVAILLASHHLDEVTSLCRRAFVLVGGTCRYLGSPADLGADSASRALQDLLVREVMS
jgi:ABC-2 type transport system ATP-binding protein